MPACSKSRWLDFRWASWKERCLIMRTKRPHPAGIAALKATLQPLWRVPAYEADLAFYLGPSWRARIPASAAVDVRGQGRHGLRSGFKRVGIYRGVCESLPPRVPSSMLAASSTSRRTGEKVSADSKVLPPRASTGHPRPCSQPTWRACMRVAVRAPVATCRPSVLVPA